MSSVIVRVAPSQTSRVLYESRAITVVSPGGLAETPDHQSYSLTDLSLVARHQHLLAVVQPLLEFFAEVDDVFSESDALTPEKRQMGMGRTYRAWKKLRNLLDPEYDSAEDQRDSSPSTGLLRTHRSVLRPGGRSNRGRSLGA